MQQSLSLTPSLSHLCGKPASKKANSFPPQFSILVFAWFFSFKSKKLFKSISVPKKLKGVLFRWVRNVLWYRQNRVGLKLEEWNELSDLRSPSLLHHRLDGIDTSWTEPCSPRFQQHILLCARTCSGNEPAWEEGLSSERLDKRRHWEHLIRSQYRLQLR